MSTQPIQASAIRELAATITRTFDTDLDGKLSTSEFSGFLSQFLGAMQKGGSAPDALARATSAAGGTVNAPADAPRAIVGTLDGFDGRKVADPTVNTTKYLMARIFQYHPNTPEGLAQALPEIQQVAPSVRIAGSNGDLLDFGDYVDPEGNRIGVVDVIQAAAPGTGRAWWWNPIT